MVKKVTKKKVAKKVAKKVTKKVVKKVVKKVAKKVAKKAPPKLPAIGSLAPTFSLVNQDGQSVSLKDFVGQYVVVYFYPRAMTPGCTVQACGLRDASKDLKKNNIVVLGISPDKPESLKKFQNRDKLNFDLLSDLDHKVALAYGSWGQKMFMGKVFDGILRQSFLLDKSGKILHIMSKVNTKTHAEDVLKFYQSL
jgi:thioredoxin-dependent peroxiredoxin